MDAKKRPGGLGRGLSALMADVKPDRGEGQGASARPDRLLPIESITPNPDQPRRRFAEEDLDDLAASITAKGIIQPLVVRPKGDRYEIVAGERRWRAAQRAKLHEVPVVIRDFDDTEVLEVAIIENVQRADLNAIEEASGYKMLMDRFGHTQEKLAEALGKSRSHIANLLRLLTLPDAVLAMVRDGRLSAGHARALVTATSPLELAEQIVRKDLSVREAERLAKAAAAQTGAKRDSAKPRQVAEKDADTRALEADLSAALGLKVSIEHQPGADGGRLILNYSSFDELDDLCRVLSTPNIFK